MIIELCEAPEIGRVLYDNGAARAADLGNDLFVLQAGGRTVQFGALALAEGAQWLINTAPLASASIMQASQAILTDLEARLPADE